MDEANTSQSISSDDQEFEVTAEMMIDEDDYEDTIDEEEELDEGDEDELADLQKEGEMPIEDLIRIYYKTDNPQAGVVPENETNYIKDCETSDISQINDDFDPFGNQRITRGLAAVNSQYIDEEFSSDEEYQPTAEDWKKEIQIGPDHQAVVKPFLCPYKEGEDTAEKDDKLLWKPDIISPQKLQNYLTVVYKLMEHGYQAPDHDDEQALFTLLQTGDVTLAINKRQEQESHPTDIALWSEEECQNFEQGLRVFGKDFRLIQQNKVQSRTVGEIVQFYYLWKKTERHDAFVTQTKLGRKKYAIPGIADMMGRFIEENESLYSSRSGSPVSSSEIITNNPLIKEDIEQEVFRFKDYTNKGTLNSTCSAQYGERIEHEPQTHINSNTEIWRVSSHAQPLSSAN
ncbi:mesoderm induction early response protein 1 isoform X1 [Hydra vulgaris]|uniref:mesoderm induction early response protein 1 isoform X1 n=1 Tax=Hydra vulgaris TaxID=6087 RepID=UPI001F5F97DE|nr:mesoderm induction early response protein 1-like [Hydra vulgaris]